jgi:hypothetical protein
VPFDFLALSDFERDFLNVSDPASSSEERIDAARRIASRMKHKPRGVTEHDRVVAVFLAVGETQKELDTMPRSGRGRPRNVEPWHPWHWDWSLALRLLLPLFFRRELTPVNQYDVLAQPRVALEAIAELEANDDGDDLSTALAKNGVREPRVSRFHHEPDFLRGGQDGVSERAREALRLKLGSGKLTSPPLTRREREVIRGQIHRPEGPLAFRDNAPPETVGQDLRGRSDGNGARRPVVLGLDIDATGRDASRSKME